MAFDTSDHPWQPISTVPQDVEVDVFFVNGSFVEPARGILANALKQEEFWVSQTTGGGVPETYIVLWRRRVRPEKQDVCDSGTPAAAATDKVRHLKVVKNFDD